MNKWPSLQLSGVSISPADLSRAYSSKEFAEITGYCPRMLSALKAEGNPAWKAGKWHLYPWLLWTAGLLPERKKQGRPRS